MTRRVSVISRDFIPGNEAQRLAAVRRYNILDTPPDGAFDRITRLAARLLQVPISIVSVVDTDRIWFKSHHGLNIDRIDREPGLCASAILQHQPWLVADALVDPRTLTNSLVAGDFGLRFYAGIPLTTPDGHNLGTLCVLDHQPREITDVEVTTLQDLAAIVMDELELRLGARRAVSAETNRRRSAEEIARSLQDSLLPVSLPNIDGFDMQARYHVAHTDEVGGDFYDVIEIDDGWMAVIGDVSGKGIEAASLTGTARWTLRAVSLDTSSPAEALGRLNNALVRLRDHSGRYCTMAVVSIRPHPGKGAKMRVSLGGHPHPLVVRSDGRVERLGVTAPMVGSFPDVEFTDTDAELAPRDVMVMFTDGMLGTLAGRGSMDDAALQRMLAPLAGHSAEEVADRLDIELGKGDLQDDAAFLVITAE